MTHDSSGPRSDPELGAADVVTMLQRELLAPLDPDVIDAHLEAMFLEFAWSHVDGADRGRRRWVRAAVCAGCVGAALTLTAGLAAAGALPAPAQHWLGRATRVVGIHLPGVSTHQPPPAVGPSEVAPGPSRASHRVSTAGNTASSAPRLVHQAKSFATPTSARPAAHASASDGSLKSASEPVTSSPETSRGVVSGPPAAPGHGNPHSPPAEKVPGTGKVKVTGRSNGSGNGEGNGSGNADGNGRGNGQVKAISNGNGKVKVIPNGNGGGNDNGRADAAQNVTTSTVVRGVFPGS